MQACNTAVPFVRRSKNSLRMLIPRLVLGTGVLIGSGSQAAEIEEIVILERQQPNEYMLDRSTLGKLTESLQDTPQSIAVITGQLLEDRAAMSLNDALRNVPGLTLGAGEFSWQGNNPTIRGFTSRNDMFLDGMRDFGSYDRDPFNLQSIEVLQGPSSMVFGRGSTGGVINQASKLPVAGSLRSLHLNLGNADTRRVTVDVNEPLSDSVALRLNLLKHEGGVAGRNGADSDRYGIAPSLSVELGSGTLMTLSYLKQQSDIVPDYGLPWLHGAPAAVERSNYYGFDSDFIDTDVDIATLKLDHEATEDTRIQIMLRHADYQRDTRITEPLLVGNPSTGTPLADIRVNRNVFRGESGERMLQGQVNLVSRLTSGAVEHAVVAGVEVGTESSDPAFGFGLGVPTTSLLAPVQEPFSSSGIAWRVRSEASADTLAGYVLDTMKFNEQWQLMAGLRWDRFGIDYQADRYNDDGSFRGNEQIQRTDIKTSFRVALVYKPVESGTFYLGTGTSFNPSGEGLSFINSGRNLTIGDAYLQPENNRTVELGTKWNLFGGDLFIDAALFHIEKSNARVPDPATPGFNALAGKQTVDGFSVSAVGRLNEFFSVNGGYTWLDSEQGRTTQLTVLPGTPLANVGEHTWSLWLTWDPNAKLQIASGVRFVDERLATITQPLKAVPDYTAVDAMVKYQASDNLTFKVNVTNLTDEYYFDQLHPFHVVPGPGLTSVFAVNLDY